MPNSCSLLLDSFVAVRKLDALHCSARAELDQLLLRNKRTFGVAATQSECLQTANHAVQTDVSTPASECQGERVFPTLRKLRKSPGLRLAMQDVLRELSEVRGRLQCWQGGPCRGAEFPQ